MNARERAAMLRLPRYNDTVPVPRPGTVDDDGDAVVTYYRTATVPDTGDGDGGAIVVRSSDGETRMYPPPGRAADRFGGEPYLPADDTELPEEAADELRPDILAHYGLVVTDELPSRDTLFRHAAKLHDLPIVLAVVDDLLMAVDDGAGQSMVWYRAEALRRLGYAPPLSIAPTLVRTPPDGDVDDPDAVAEIRHGLARHLDAQIAELTRMRATLTTHVPSTTDDRAARDDGSGVDA